MESFTAVVEQFFMTYAYKPAYVYSGLFFFMYASAFGLPIPEEIMLVSTGFLAYMALHPEIAPPPEPGMTGVNPTVLAFVALFAVISSDCIIWWLGRHFGTRFFKIRFIQRVLPPARLEKVQEWSHRYGFWASGIFRFTPGLRFPGHLVCGMMGIPLWKFLAVDGTAALLTVPTQILLIAHYGEHILLYFKKFKIAVFGLLAVFALVFFIRRFLRRRWATANPGETP